MNLNQYKEKKNSRKILIIIGAILLFVGGIIVDRTFANFRENKSFKVMEGNFIYEGSGDVMFAFYKGDELLTQMPKKDNEEKLTFVKGECDKGASIKWDYNNWQPTVVNLQESKTTCKLYFGQEYDTICNSAGVDSGACYLAKKVGSDSSIIYDNTIDNNVRFIGSTPNNYVTFNNELWQIIGVMNNIEDESGNKKSHLKIIRYTSIGSYSWDSSLVNSGYGVNEWSEADIQKVLNDNYYNKKAGGTCYSSEKNKVATCPNWTNIGLNDEARGMVSKIKWNTGTMPVDFYENGGLITPPYMYEAERSKNTVCTYGDNCDDNVERKYNWKGYVGLIYPSDYGYSTSGGGESQRQTCLNTTMLIWTNENNNSNKVCPLNSWVPSLLCTMTPVSYTRSEYDRAYYSIFSVKSNRNVDRDNPASAYYIYPVVYLNSNVKIEPDDSDDYGTKTNPYRLTI